MLKFPLVVFVLTASLCLSGILAETCTLCSSNQNIVAIANVTTSQGNGCGSQLFGINTWRWNKEVIWSTLQDTYRVIPDFSFTDCCNAHDICYSTCGGGNTKSSCDATLYQCSLATCPSQPTAYKRALCRIAAQCYAAALNDRFCLFYTESQKAACTCQASTAPAQNVTSNPNLPNLDSLHCPPSIEDIIEEEIRGGDTVDVTNPGATNQPASSARIATISIQLASIVLSYAFLM